jgi:hypothetical protein
MSLSGWTIEIPNPANGVETRVFSFDRVLSFSEATESVLVLGALISSECKSAVDASNTQTAVEARVQRGADTAVLSCGCTRHMVFLEYGHAALARTGEL